MRRDLRVREALGRYRYWLASAGVTGAYIGSAKLGLKLSVAHGVITPVWPPTGISLAALVLGGLRLWPAVAVGAFVSNVTTGASPGVAAAIAVGNTLEAVVGAYLLRRVGFRASFDRVRDVLAFTVLAALFSTALSATNGVTTLAIAGAAAASPYGSAWKLWWLGDAMGNFLVAPVILLWATRFPKGLDRRKIGEGVLLAGLVAGISAVVFLAGLWRYPYLLFPLLIWATFRFKQLGAATASFIAAAIAVAGVVSNLAPIAGHDPTRGVQILQALLAFVAVSLLMLAATLAEREVAESALQRAHERLAEAQAISHLGSWEWDVASGRLTWSRELYRIYGLEPGTEVSYDSYLARIHPGDREQMRATIEQALEERLPFETVHRILLPDGSERVVQGRGRVVLGADGKPHRMAGTAQDVTERRRLEAVRENILATVSHELRTPLTSIIGFAITLRERQEQLTEQLRRQIVVHLTEQALKLDRLLSNLLDLDRLREGRAELALERQDLASLVEQVAASQPAGGHTVEVVSEPVVAMVDGPKVERIVENLLANAVKHTPPGTRIELSVRPEGDDAVVIRVDDDGPGIADIDKDAIFELFGRAPGNPTRGEGAGVGLALVAQFTALHDGDAWVEDGAGGGASFRVRLPRRTVGS